MNKKNKASKIQEDTVYKVKRKNKKKKSKILIVFSLLIIIFAISFAITYFANGNYLKPFNDLKSITTKNEVKPPEQVTQTNIITLDTAGMYRFTNYKNSLIICGMDSVKALNENGKEEWNYPIALDIPVLSANEKGVIAGSRGENNITYIKDKNTIKTIPLEAPLINARINSSGYISVITDPKGYKGGVYVYNPSNELIFKWLSGTSNLVDASLSPNGKLLAVATIDTSSGIVSGNISLFNITAGEKPYAGQSYADNMISHLEWYNNDRLGCVGDKYYLKLNSSGSELSRYDFNSSSLLSFNISNQNMPVFALGNDNLDTSRDCTLDIVDAKGKRQGEFTVLNEVKNIEVVGNEIIVTTSREVLIMGSKGNVKNRIKLVKDIRSGHIFPSKKNVLVISGAVAEIMKIR